MMEHLQPRSAEAVSLSIHRVSLIPRLDTSHGRGSGVTSHGTGHTQSRTVADDAVDGIYSSRCWLALRGRSPPGAEIDAD